MPVAAMANLACISYQVGISGTAGGTSTIVTLRAGGAAFEIGGSASRGLRWQIDQPCIYADSGLMSYARWCGILRYPLWIGWTKKRASRDLVGAFPHRRSPVARLPLTRLLGTL